MKSLLKITTLLSILLLIPISVVAGEQLDGNSSNATVTDNSTVQSIQQPIHNESIRPPELQKKILPLREDVLAFANESNATDNTTLENQIIAHNASWYWDTYLVRTTDAKEYTVVVVYDNEQTKTDFGRVQLYVSEKGIGLVQPTPMLICRSLNITALDGSWTFNTKTIKSYKIVKSYFGKKIIDNPPVIDTSKELGCVVNNSTEPVPVAQNQIIDNVSQVIENNSIENSTVVQNSGSQDNNTNIVKNSKGIIQNQGNGNLINQFFLELSNIKDSTINFFVNFGGN